LYYKTLGTAIAHGLSYADFLAMSMAEVHAVVERVAQVEELKNYDLAVKVGQLFSKDGLQAPSFISEQGKITEVVDASQVSEQERQAYISRIMSKKAQADEKNVEILSQRG